MFSRTLWTQAEASVGSFAVWHHKATVTVHSDCGTIPINHVSKLESTLNAFIFVCVGVGGGKEAQSLLMSSAFSGAALIPCLPGDYSYHKQGLNSCLVVFDALETNQLLITKSFKG